MFEYSTYELRLTDDQLRQVWRDLVYGDGNRFVKVPGNVVVDCDLIREGSQWRVEIPMAYSLEGLDFPRKSVYPRS